MLIVCGDFLSEKTLPSQPERAMNKTSPLEKCRLAWDRSLKESTAGIKKEAKKKGKNSAEGKQPEEQLAESIAEAKLLEALLIAEEKWKECLETCKLRYGK